MYSFAKIGIAYSSTKGILIKGISFGFQPLGLGHLRVFLAISLKRTNTALYPLIGLSSRCLKPEHHNNKFKIPACCPFSVGLIKFTIAWIMSELWQR